VFADAVGVERVSDRAKACFSDQWIHLKMFRKTIDTPTAQPIFGRNIGRETVKRHKSQSLFTDDYGISGFFCRFRYRD
jgi:hypothetical protein